MLFFDLIIVYLVHDNFNNVEFLSHDHTSIFHFLFTDNTNIIAILSCFISLSNSIFIGFEHYFAFTFVRVVWKVEQGKLDFAI